LRTRLKLIARLPWPEYPDDEYVAGRRVIACIRMQLVHDNMVLGYQFPTAWMLTSAKATRVFDQAANRRSDGSHAARSRGTGAGLRVPAINAGNVVNRSLGQEKRAPFPLATGRVSRNRT